MCRYLDHDYKTSYACLKHRQVRQAPMGQHPLCPVCREIMMHLGRDFKAPRKTNDSQWRKLQLIAKPGLFDSCGCSGPGYRPKTLGEAKAALTRRR